jgi:molybdopterin molybdotransferase
MQLLTVDETRVRVLAGIEPIGSETISLWQAGDRLVAESVVATIALPRFDNSTMDGYAVRSAEAKSGRKLRVAAEQAAGADRGFVLPPEAAIRVYTGAPVPCGADAVIMQEDCHRNGDAISIAETVSPGENIRRCGSDLAEGQLVVQVGDRLSAQGMAVLASQGHDQVRVFRRPYAAVLATGSELRQSGEELAAGEIYETNRIMIAEMVRRVGSAPVVSETIPDDLAATKAALKNALDSDALIIVGGMSVGEYDYAKSALREMGAEIDLWRVAVKPGKPFLFGRLNQKPVFGLPGNPVSAFVTFFLFVRPALLQMAGSRQLSPVKANVPVACALQNRGNRPHFLRGRVEEGKFLPVGQQESHALFGLSQSDVVVELGSGRSLAPGEMVEAIWL